MTDDIGASLRPLLTELDPTTREIGFVEARATDAARALADWWRGDSRISHPVPRDLKNALMLLSPPAREGHTAFLLVPTRSRWTALFDNGSMGADAFTFVTAITERTGARGLRVVWTDPAFQPHLYSARIVEIYDQASEMFSRRSVVVADDGGQWVFQNQGEPFEFEESNWYSASRVKDRFPPIAMREFLRSLNAEPFDPQFYDPQQSVLVEHRTSSREDSQQPG